MEYLTFGGAGAKRLDCRLDNDSTIMFIITIIFIILAWIFVHMNRDRGKK